MNRRYLTEQQKNRIRQQQQDRVLRARQNKVKEEDHDYGNLSDTSESGLVVAHYGDCVDVETAKHGVQRCYLRQNLEPLVVGDKIMWCKTTHHVGVVIALEERHTLLARPDRFGKLKPLAANINYLIIVTAPEPLFSELLLDQYIVAAHANAVLPIIVLNKVDMLSSDDLNGLRQALQYYQTLGYTVLETSTHNPQSLTRLIDTISPGSAVLVGQSGVGKSSILNALIPDKNIQTGRLSETGLGMHTTSTAYLYHLSTACSIIDSPGVREFSLGHLPKEDIIAGFKEISETAKACKFRDCTHSHEPDCAVLQAIAEGQINVGRLSRLKTLLSAQTL